MSGTVLVLNSTYEVLEHISWQRAVVLVVSGEADVHEADPEVQVRSQHLSLPMPRVVRLRRYVFVRFARGHGAATRAGVLARDRHTCVYCGGRGDTVDHLLPSSRGGPGTWENLAACCGPCNLRKADRTPEEAGMRPRWQPWRPDRRVRAQRVVWAAIA